MFVDSGLTELLVCTFVLLCCSCFCVVDVQPVALLCHTEACIVSSKNSVVRPRQRQYAKDGKSVDCTEHELLSVSTCRKLWNCPRRMRRKKLCKLMEFFLVHHGNLGTKRMLLMWTARVTFMCLPSDFSCGDSIDLNKYLHRMWYSSVALNCLSVLYGFVSFVRLLGGRTVINRVEECCTEERCADVDVDCSRRDQAMQRALTAAINVPMTVAKKANTTWPTLKELAKVFNINCKSDLQASFLWVSLRCTMSALAVYVSASVQQLLSIELAKKLQVGAKCMETGVYGAYYNVLVNLKDLKDDKQKAEVTSWAPNCGSLCVNHHTRRNLTQRSRQDIVHLGCFFLCCSCRRKSRLSWRLRRPGARRCSKSSRAERPILSEQKHRMISFQPFSL